MIAGSAVAAAIALVFFFFLFFNYEQLHFRLVYKCEYFLGQGAGDLYVKAECRLLIQTYAIVDAIKAGDSTFVKQSFNLPSSYSISFKGKQSQKSNGTCDVLLWYATSNAIGIGVIDDSGNMCVADFVSGWQKQVIGTIPLNTWKTFEYTYNNGVHTLTVDGVSKTLTKTISSPQITFEHNTYGEVKELIIKPL